MNQNELRQLQNEPTCQHNGKSKSGCVRTTPGETQGGCFFDAILRQEPLDAGETDAAQSPGDKRDAPLQAL